jgi:hypothetical protein
VWRWAVVAVALPLTACALPFTPSGAVEASIPGYHRILDIPLPGGTGRWDYQVLDPSTHRLYIAHLGANEVVVFDTSQQR